MAEENHAIPGIAPIYPILTREEIIKADDARIQRISDEMRKGFRIIEKYPKSVTFFGSARFAPGHEYYEAARKIASELSKEGYTIVTGGGPGIMEAANRGAFEAGGSSVGLNIHLPKEQHINPYTTDGAEFQYFFTRKVALAFAAEAYVYFPGGFGTLDEFYELVTMIQTRRVPAVPVICYGSAFWKPFDEVHGRILRDELKTISPGDERVYHISDDVAEIVHIIKNEPIRNGIAFPHA